MNGLNPNWVLVVVAALTALAGASEAVVFWLGGSPGDVVTRAGLIATVYAPTVTSLLALLRASRADVRSDQLAQGQGKMRERLEAARSRITHLEGRLKRAGIGPHVDTPEEPK